MIRTRWYKVVQDLLGNKLRTLLVVLAIAVGVFAVGMIATTSRIIGREMARSYDESNAASAMVLTEPFTDDLVESIERLPQVEMAEGRQALPVQVNTGPSEWRDLLLVGIDDFEAIQLNKVRPSGDKWPPSEREVLIERSSMTFINGVVGDTLLVELPDGTQRELPLVGQAHDVSFPAADFTDLAFGYVTLDTLEWLGSTGLYTELRFSVTGDRMDFENIRSVSETVEEKIEKSGREVFWTTIPPAGEHWANEIIQTVLLLLSLIGVLTLFLSGFLVINTISAVLAQQVNEIGVMKLVGARRRHVMSMYFVMILTYGLLSLVFAVPLGAVAAFAFSSFIASKVNIDIASYGIPWQVLALEIAAGLLVPLLAGAWPVIQGVRVTTYTALNDIGLGSGQYGQGWIDRFFLQLRHMLPVSRPLILSLRNTVRHKGRLIRTLIMLTLGSAIFISVMSVRDSLLLTMDNFMDYHQYDVSVVLNRPYRAKQLRRQAERLPGVEYLETWGASVARRQRPDGTYSDSFDLIAPPSDTEFIEPTLLEGRWLIPEDQNAVVIDTVFTHFEEDVEVGDELVIDLNGRETTWKVVGLARGLVFNARVYANYDYYERAARQVGKASQIYLRTRQHDGQFQDQVARQSTDLFKEAGFKLGDVRTTEARRELIAFQMSLLVIFLVIMALLTAVVGSLGLSATMSINVMERTREIAVLRAVGAPDGAIRQIVLVEGALIGILSWFAGAILAIPLGQVISERVGLALLDAPLVYAYSFKGMLLWLAIVIVLSTVASGWPALRAARLTIREALAYE